VETNPFFRPWWNYWHTIDRKVASGEAARRYYSARESLQYLEHQVSFILMDLHMTANFLIQRTYDIDTVMNH
jgi:hypothetical protein